MLNLYPPPTLDNSGRDRHIGSPAPYYYNGNIKTASITELNAYREDRGHHNTSGSPLKLGDTITLLPHLHVKHKEGRSASHKGIHFHLIHHEHDGSTFSTENREDTICNNGHAYPSNSANDDESTTTLWLWCGASAHPILPLHSRSVTSGTSRSPVRLRGKKRLPKSNHPRIRTNISSPALLPSTSASSITTSTSPAHKRNEDNTNNSTLLKTTMA